MFCPLTGKVCNNVKNIHVTENLNGQPSNMFLCASCAGHLGQIVHPVDLLMNILQDVHEKEITESCPDCGYTIQEFIKTGRMGCSGCYTFFHNEIAPILAKAHEGHTKHAGKKPKHDGIHHSIEALEKKMNRAISEERYEDAAKCRDQISHLKKKLED